MADCIDPTIDCVFKAVLSAPGNENLLVSFLNAVFKPERPIVSVEILNPYNTDAHDADDFDVIQYRSNDASGPSFIGEIGICSGQVFSNRGMPSLLALYGSQQNEWDLRPAKSCWILTDEKPFHEAKSYQGCFQFCDVKHGIPLDDQLRLHCVDLAIWQQPDEWTAPDYWMHFFKHGKQMSELPDFMHEQPEMVQAMKTLQIFTKPGPELDRYETRLQARLAAS